MPTANITKLTTRSGLGIDVRRATGADEPALADLFDRVSSDDRRFRFLAPIAHAGHHQLLPLIKADHFRSESFLAFDHGTGELVASALLACDGAFDTAEIAVSICNDYKGRGVGWALLEMLSADAQRRGVRRVMSIESRSNHEAITLERENGFTCEPCEGDPALVLLSRSFR